MENFNFKLLRNACFVILASAVAFGCERGEMPKNPVVVGPGMAPDVEFTALTNDNRIVMYNAQDLNSPMSTKSVSGLESGDMLVSIDYRPATGQLYALGSSSRLYFINEHTGEATALGSQSFSPAIDGMNASIDFNPTVDRIRLVTASGQNLRLHPELGTVVATDGSISGGDNPQIGAVAYTNSIASAKETKLYDIDFAGNKLFIQTPPNDGGLQEVGDLGIDFMGEGNFDINPDNSSALAVTLHDNVSKLYTINLHSGRAEWVGTFGVPVVGIAFKTDPIVYASTSDNQLFRFNPYKPFAAPVAMKGLNNGEKLVGIDFRPANGQLYGITNQSRLVTINTANGQVTQVGQTLSPRLQGNSFGFDFNPTVDRIRLVSNTGQNLRLHPVLGTVVAEDGRLPGPNTVNGAAYSNNVATATSTQLFVLDSKANKLFLQDPPNDGGLQEIGSLGVDFTEDNGFDIGGNTGNAYSLLSVNGMMNIYRINLSTGEASLITNFNINPTGLAVGLGF